MSKRLALMHVPFQAQRCDWKVRHSGKFNLRSFPFRYYRGEGETKAQQRCGWCGVSKPNPYVVGQVGPLGR